MMYGLTMSLKNEIVQIAPRGRVNCVAPGWVRTPMAAGALADPAVVYQALATYVFSLFFPLPLALPNQVRSTHTDILTCPISNPVLPAHILSYNLSNSAVIGLVHKHNIVDIRARTVLRALLCFCNKIS